MRLQQDSEHVARDTSYDPKMRLDYALQALEIMRLSLYNMFVEMDRQQAKTEAHGGRENIWITDRETLYDLISCPAPDVDWDEGTVTEVERM